ncbi:hypothetical protein D3C83_118950 [compost metagenome]
MAATIDPEIDPSPPRMIMIRISNDLMNSNDFGFRYPSKCASNTPPAPAKAEEMTKAITL